MLAHPEVALRLHDDSRDLHRHIAYLEMQLRTIRAEAGLLASGVRYIAGEPHALADALETPIAAALPLRLDEHVTGGIVLFSLLAHKSGFEDVDYDLFDLLTRHAAIALHCTGGEVSA